MWNFWKDPLEHQSQMILLHVYQHLSSLTEFAFSIARPLHSSWHFISENENKPIIFGDFSIPGLFLHWAGVSLPGFRTKPGGGHDWPHSVLYLNKSWKAKEV